ncbi:hypothetical protein [Zoogloea sp.]|nr:hypothetical protein [Zoogloea sp.]
MPVLRVEDGEWAAAAAEVLRHLNQIAAGDEWRGDEMVDLE